MRPSITYCRLCNKELAERGQQYCKFCLSHIQELDKQPPVEDQIMKRKFKDEKKDG